MLPINMSIRCTSWKRLNGAEDRTNNGTHPVHPIHLVSLSFLFFFKGKWIKSMLRYAAEAGAAGARRMVAENADAMDSQVHHSPRIERGHFLRAEWRSQSAREREVGNLLLVNWEETKSESKCRMDAWSSSIGSGPERSARAGFIMINSLSVRLEPLFIFFSLSFSLLPLWQMNEEKKTGESYTQPNVGGSEVQEEKRGIH